MLIRCRFLVSKQYIMKLLSSLTHKLFVALIAVSPIAMSSCDDGDDTPGGGTNQYKQTVIMYMPWSGSGIYSYFKRNIEAFETAITDNRGLDGNSLVVFISENGSSSHLIKISYDDGQCLRDTLKSYDFATYDYTAPDGIAQVLGDAMACSPSDTYALAIGCHGMGWIPAGTSVETRAARDAAAAGQVHQTRYFGHSSDVTYQTDITSLAEGISRTGVKMKYVLFDDCYMSNIETAYDMRGAADYLIASTCEIMIEGMPYAEIGIDLLVNDLQGAVQGFYDFYSAFSVPCGTIAVTDCSQVEAMAQLMRDINTAYPGGIDGTDGIQDLDGYTPTIFFDYGDYVTHLCRDESLLAAFNEQLDRLVPYKACTPTYYSSITGRQTAIDTFSGLTISDPTENPAVTAAKATTAWYKATH